MTALILQGRLDSSRLPGKSLLPLGGEPLIYRVMEALNTVPCDVRVLACPADCEKSFAPLAARTGFILVTGPKDDVLTRYCIALRSILAETAAILAAAASPAEAATPRIIRATGDNPFVFADAAAALNAEAEEHDADYAGYGGLPYGAGVESVKASALLRAEAEAKAEAEREHVCPYLYNHPEMFRLHRPDAPGKWLNPDIRLSVDTKEDFARAEKLYAALSGTYGETKERFLGENILRHVSGAE
jgi:spore coat polysaccharide biosynthesis protein SpsF